VRYEAEEGGRYLVEGLDEQMQELARDPQAVPGVFAIDESSWQEPA
jgi:hypothetical protein